MSFYNSKIVNWLQEHHVPVHLILSVIAGIMASKVLTVITHGALHIAGVFPSLSEPMFDEDLLIISLSFHSIYAVAGAFITAWMAREKAKKAVFILGSKEAILWLLGIILLWKHNPAWFNLTKAIVGIPLAVLGGKIYSAYKNRKKIAGA